MRPQDRTDAIVSLLDANGGEMTLQELRDAFYRLHPRRAKAYNVANARAAFARHLNDAIAATRWESERVIWHRDGTVALMPVYSDAK